MKPEEHVSCYSTKNERRLKAICELLKKLGIDTFWYYTISESGHFTFVGNEIGIAEYFYHNKLYVNHPSFRSPELITEGNSIFKNEIDEYGRQEQVNNEFSMDHILEVVKKKEKKLHGLILLN